MTKHITALQPGSLHGSTALYCTVTSPFESIDLDLLINAYEPVWFHLVLFQEEELFNLLLPNRNIKFFFFIFFSLWYFLVFEYSDCIVCACQSLCK